MTSMVHEGNLDDMPEVDLSKDDKKGKTKKPVKWDDMKGSVSFGVKDKAELDGDVVVYANGLIVQSIPFDSDDDGAVKAVQYCITNMQDRYIRLNFDNFVRYYIEFGGPDSADYYKSFQPSDGKGRRYRKK